MDFLVCRCAVVDSDGVETESNLGNQQALAHGLTAWSARRHTEIHEIMAAAHHFDDKKANFKVLLTTAFGAKEVDCRVRLTIHTVTNLPVLDGAYRVRWKFRDISAKATRAQHNKQLAVNLGVGEVGHASTNSDPTLSPSSPTSSTAHSSSVTANSKPSDVNISPDERGTTAYRNLNKRDHSVTFEHTVEVVAHMRVVRGELIGEPLKLVIERVSLFPRVTEFADSSIAHTVHRRNHGIRNDEV